MPMANFPSGGGAGGSGWISVHGELLYLIDSGEEVKPSIMRLAFNGVAESSAEQGNGAATTTPAARRGRGAATSTPAARRGKGVVARTLAGRGKGTNT